MLFNYGKVQTFIYQKWQSHLVLKTSICKLFVNNLIKNLQFIALAE